MRIHEIEAAPLRELQSLVARESFDALLAFAAPTSWPVLAALQLEAPRPWSVLVPCVNEHNHAVLTGRPALLGSYRQLAGADDLVLGYSSHAGWDARLLGELALSGHYVPNAVERREPSGAFRARHGIREDVPLLVAIGNLWHEKNHLALIEELRRSDRQFRLAIIGRPVAHPEHASIPGRIAELAAADERIVHVPGADAGGVAAALCEAWLLLLPSLAEATPLVLLEAMSHAVPWIATPTCGSADDHAGGLILPLHQFRDGVEALLGDEPLRRALGEAGMAHWTASYTWDAVGPRYARLLAGATQLAPLEAPAWALDVTEQARTAILDGAILEAAA
jgi:glycosyltransferase involved in cell wall biosynthesis